MKFNHILFATSVALAGLITTTSSYAAYAVSYTNISAFGILGINTNVSVSGFSFSNSSAVSGTGYIGSADFGTSADAGSSCLGNCTGFINEFFPHSAADFIYGDAQVGSTNIDGDAGQASAIAEANISSGLAFATGSNSLTGGNIVVISASENIQFSFLLDNYLEVSGSGMGTAWSSINMTIDNVALDLSSLNYSISSGNVGISAQLITSDIISLAQGTHNISIAMDNNINLTAVPVPAAVWLLGSALIGLVGFALKGKK